MKMLKSIVFKSTLSVAILASGGITATSIIYAEPQQSPSRTGTPNMEHGGQGHRSHHKGHLQGGPIITDTATLIGIQPRSLIEQLKQGKTLLQVVQAKKGWSEDEYLKKLNEKAVQHIDQAVTTGKLNKDQADKIKAGLPERLKRVINRTWKNSQPGHPVSEYRNNTIQLNVSE